MSGQYGWKKGSLSVWFKIIMSDEGGRRSGRGMEILPMIAGCSGELILCHRTQQRGRIGGGKEAYMNVHL